MRKYKLSLRHKQQSVRQAKVAQLISVSISEFLRRGSGFDYNLIDCPITITSVKISADLKVASCFFMPFNTKLTGDQLLEALEESKYIIRKHVASKIQLKFTPEIRFFVDYDYELSHIYDKVAVSNA